MEVKILEEKKRRLVFETDADRGFCNALKKELWNVKGVTLASFSVAHPLVGRPEFVVETDATVDPKAALKKASEKLKKYALDFKKELKKIK